MYIGINNSLQKQHISFFWVGGETQELPEGETYLIPFFNFFLF